MKRNILGPRIRERRREIGITQADLARQVEISASYLNLIEHNKRDIGGTLLRKLANALDLHLAVVGGSVALGLGEPFFAAAQHECDRICTLDYSRGTRIEPVGLGVEAPLVGAAAVGFRSIGHDLGGLA